MSFSMEIIFLQADEGPHCCPGQWRLDQISGDGDVAMDGKVPVSEADSCGVENFDYPPI